MALKQNGPAAVARGEARNCLEGTLDAHLLTAKPSSSKRSHGSVSQLRTLLKVAIVDAFSADQLSQERAIRLIRAFGLEAA